MIYSRMLEEIEAYVTQLFQKHETEKQLFYNLARTCEVVSRTEEIAANVSLSDSDRFVLLAAAWFQNTGRLFSTAGAPTEKSVDVARSFFATNPPADDGLTEKIETLVRYTAFTRPPENVREEVLHDANTYYLSQDNFKKLNKALRKEERLKGSNKDLNWKQNTLAFLNQHNYYTPYCRTKLEKKKLSNIAALMQKTGAAGLPNTAPGEKKSQTAQIKAVQTMMRVMNDNHIEFSSIADNKANLLISVNAIMISVILSVLVRRLEVDPHLVVPTIIFLIVGVATIVLAILSTKPKVSSGVFTRDDVLNRRINLMFFGNYYKTKVEDYEWGMKKLMNDPDYLYGTMVRDMHQLGVVLAKKYRLIGAAYTVFMYGIIVTIIAFVIAIMIGPPASGLPIAM